MTTPVWIYENILTPIGHGLQWLAEKTYENLLTPIGHGAISFKNWTGDVAESMADSIKSGAQTVSSFFTEDIPKFFRSIGSSAPA